MNSPCDTARLTWITIRTVPANVKCPNGFPPQAGGVTLFPDRFEPRTVDNLEHAFSALCTILSLTVFFLLLKFSKGIRLRLIYYSGELCAVTWPNHVLHSASEIPGKTGQNSSFWIPLGFFVIAFDFYFIPFKNLRHSNLTIWWDGFDLNKKTRIKNFSIPIFPGSHLANLTFSLTSRTNWLPFP